MVSTLELLISHILHTPWQVSGLSSTINIISTLLAGHSSCFPGSGGHWKHLVFAFSLRHLQIHWNLDCSYYIYESPHIGGLLEVILYFKDHLSKLGRPKVRDKQVRIHFEPSCCCICRIGTRTGPWSFLRSL